MKRNLGTVLSALFGAALLFGSPFGAEPARATDLRAVGGSGGNDYRFEGNAPGYVVGFQGKMGAWIDQLQIVCAGWDANAVSLLQGEPSEAVGDSTGGEPGSELCPEGWAIVETAIQVQREPLVLHSVVFKCRPVSGGGEVVSRSFGSTEEIGGFRVSAIVEACPEGEMMSGFHGRSGEYVDAFGMICGPSPENRVSDADKQAKVRSSGRARRSPMSTRRARDLSSGRATMSPTQSRKARSSPGPIRPSRANLRNPPSLPMPAASRWTAWAVAG